jgi:xanthine dehydrogenase/oxidase
MCSVVFFATRDAIKAARRQRGVDESLTSRSPATLERIRIEVGNSIMKRGTVGPIEREKRIFYEGDILNF